MSHGGSAITIRRLAGRNMGPMVSTVREARKQVAIIKPAPFYCKPYNKEEIRIIENFENVLDLICIGIENNHSFPVSNNDIRNR